MDMRKAFFELHALHELIIQVRSAPKSLPHINIGDWRPTSEEYKSKLNDIWARAMAHIETLKFDAMLSGEFGEQGREIANVFAEDFENVRKSGRGAPFNLPRYIAACGPYQRQFQYYKDYDSMEISEDVHDTRNRLWFLITGMRFYSRGDRDRKKVA